MSARTFDVIRREDETGVSGTGIVVEGIVFSDGTCVTRWVSQLSPGRSTVVWDSFGAFVSIHISPHLDNKTQIIFSDGEMYEGAQKVKNARKPRKRRETATNGK
jgi:hypothetical protein